MNNFNTKFHTMIQSDDGSYTAYSKEYNEHYHSTKDGALYESLVKHVIPAFKIKSTLEEITILDICFGLGFNTFSTLFYVRENFPDIKVNIYSPELDASLVNSLNDFIYPKEFDGFKNIISELIKNGVYNDEYFHIEIYIGDAREYIRTLKTNMFDIVYQDAFSPATNPILWTKEYFSDIKDTMKDDAVLTTYSIAFATRLALYENNFNIYINSGEGFRDATIASLVILKEFNKVDMEHKISCNPDKKSLRD